jgi:hypothetical protein
MISGLGVVILVHVNGVYGWGLLPVVAWTWYVLIGASTTLLTGIAVERIVKDPARQ